MNKILTPQIIANEALMVLESNLTMANLVHRDYSKEFVKVGDTITVRKPAKFVAKNFIGEVEEQDISEGSADVKMDRYRDVTVNVTSKEMTLDIKDFSEQENRYLAQMPSFSIEKLLDGEFQTEMDNYINDHFIFRDIWIKIKSGLEMLLR